MSKRLIVFTVLIPVLLIVAPNAFASHHTNNCCIYPRNGSGSIFERGLDAGTVMAQQGDAAPNYDDCIGDGGNQATYGNQVAAYCSGLVQGYNAFGR